MKNANIIKEHLTANREQWFQYRRTLSENLATLETIYTANLQCQCTPEQTVAAYVEAVGYDAAVEVIGSLINRSAWDGRISRHAADWAKNLENAWDEEAADRLELYSSRIHMAHLDQIAQAMMDYQPTTEEEEIREDVVKDIITSAANDLGTDAADFANALKEYAVIVQRVYEDYQGQGRPGDKSKTPKKKIKGLREASKQTVDWGNTGGYTELFFDCESCKVWGIPQVSFGHHSYTIYNDPEIIKLGEPEIHLTAREICGLIEGTIQKEVFGTLRMEV